MFEARTIEAAHDEANGGGGGRGVGVGAAAPNRAVDGALPGRLIIGYHMKSERQCQRDVDCRSSSHDNGAHSSVRQMLECFRSGAQRCQAAEMQGGESGGVN